MMSERMCCAVVVPRGRSEDGVLIRRLVNFEPVLRQRHCSADDINAHAEWLEHDTLSLAENMVISRDFRKHFNDNEVLQSIAYDN